MTDWRLNVEGAEASREERWQNLPRPAMAAARGPENYRAEPELLDAVDTALALGQPLLVTGEPGCGKTELGDYVAWRLGLGQAIRYDSKSSMASRDLLYQYDSLGRFHAAQEATRTHTMIDPRRFITFVGLGLAIVRANAWPDVVRLFPEDSTPHERTRSVVLIDEIDKAPRDTPNDLLSELEAMSFTVPELDKSVTAPSEMRPIVIITSNSEKALPDAFLRRCVYYHMPPVDRKKILEIAAARLPELPRDSGLLGDIVDIFEKARGLRLRKLPGSAEFIGFALALQRLGYEPDSRLDAKDESWQRKAVVTLFKSEGDQEAGRDMLKAWKRS